MHPEEKDKNKLEAKENKVCPETAKNSQSQKSPEEQITVSKTEYTDLKKVAGEKDQLYERLLRLQAEFENYKKRILKEKEELIQYANGELICELLDIVDNLERAVESSEKKHDDKLLHQGVKLIMKDMHEFLKRQNVSKIECLNQKFDPHRHEAVMQVENNDKAEDTVVEEIRKGYKVGEKVLRPAMVKVSKKSTPKEEKREEKKPEDKNHPPSPLST